MSRGMVEKISREISPNAALVQREPLLSACSEENWGRQDKRLSAGELEQVKTKILAEIKKADEKRKLPYHNEAHTRAVLERVRELAEQAALPRGAYQLLLLGALFHDYVHGVSSPDSDSLEEQSAVAADRWAASMNFSLEQRLTLYGLIISTTFSQPEICPRTKLEKLLVIADLGGFINSNEVWLKESLDVSREKPKHKRPVNLEAWVREQMSFLSLTQQRLTVEARQLGWEEFLEEKRTLLQDISMGATPNELQKSVREIEEFLDSSS